MRIKMSLAAAILAVSASQLQADVSICDGTRLHAGSQAVDLQKGGLLAEGEVVAPSLPVFVTPTPAGEKSPKLAFLMSLVLPGAGQLYAGAPKRGAGFLAVEASSWVAYGLLTSKGNEKKSEFRAFADAHWDIDKYVHWRTSYATHGDTTHSLPFKDDQDRSDYESKYPGQPGRGVEIDAQQYYELLGKYDQFVDGWDDKQRRDEADSTQLVTSVNRVKYEDMRNDSNKLLKRASLGLGVALFNHVISAIDAAKFARTHGKTAAIGERVRIRLDLVTEDQHQTPVITASKRFK